MFSGEKYFLNDNIPDNRHIYRFLLNEMVWLPDGKTAFFPRMLSHDWLIRILPLSTSKKKEIVSPSRIVEWISITVEGKSVLLSYD